MIVRRRHVFFLAGFDPKGASYYHALYKAQAQLQVSLQGVSYEVGPRVRCPDGNSQWQVKCISSSGTTETLYEHVRWDDIVRSHWPRTGRHIATACVRVYANALKWSEPLRKVWRHSPRTLVSLAYPILYWLAALLLCLVAGWSVRRLVQALLPTAGAMVQLALGAAAAGACWWAAVAWERRINTTWLVRIYAFAIRWARGELTDVPTRVDALAAAICQRLRDPELDEVLLVGFSVGSMLAVSAAARVQKDAPPLLLARFKVLTLGHCIPLLGLIPEAREFRAELAQLGGNPRVGWIDYSSPTDWGSFALVDPISLCLGDATPVAHPPRMASPRFHLMFPAERYRRMRKDKRRMHMQYLMAGELATQYDYFAITAGSKPMRLQTEDTAAT
jgi:hypothetical protein